MTLFIVLFGWLWRTMAVWILDRHSVCANLHLSIGSAVLRCQERLCDLCVTEGVFHRWELEPEGEGLILCECSWARTHGLWNFIEASELKQHIVSVLMWAYDSCHRTDIPKWPHTWILLIVSVISFLHISMSDSGHCCYNKKEPMNDLTWDYDQLP